MGGGEDVEGGVPKMGRMQLGEAGGGGRLVGGIKWRKDRMRQRMGKGGVEAGRRSREQSGGGWGVEKTSRH